VYHEDAPVLTSLCKIGDGFRPLIGITRGEEREVDDRDGIIVVGMNGLITGSGGGEDVVGGNGSEVGRFS